MSKHVRMDRKTGFCFFTPSGELLPEPGSADRTTALRSENERATCRFLKRLQRSSLVSFQVMGGILGAFQPPYVKRPGLKIDIGPLQVDYSETRSPCRNANRAIKWPRLP